MIKNWKERISNMINFESQEFLLCKKWISKKKSEGFSWEEIELLCVNESEVENELEELKLFENWPDELNISVWSELVKYESESSIPITVKYGNEGEGIDNGKTENSYSVPTGKGSSWLEFKQHLVNQGFNSRSIANVENSSLWIMNHLSEDTRLGGPIKGLVAGSVQSGKTANMEGLISMLADRGWNFFVILSGTIDNLRKQTQQRFSDDLKNSHGIAWRVLDFTKEDKNIPETELKLNAIGHYDYNMRYVTVCLKQRRRLENLINWLHSDRARAAKIRMVVIDDEADQASVNTGKITAEENQERKAINQLIVNFVNGKEADGIITSAPFQAVNYISFTATPYANVLNEPFEESLYPKDFIYSLKDSDDYFGVNTIFGNSDREDCPGLNIVRTISPQEVRELTYLHKHESGDIPSEMKRAICWFLCAAAVLRRRGHKKPISMLIHTTAIQNYHFDEYETTRNWLMLYQDQVMNLCKKVYESEKDAFRKEDLMKDYPGGYGSIDSVNDEFPDFKEISSEIQFILSDIGSIKMDDDKELVFHKGVHICVDNCRAKRWAKENEEEGTNLRIVYPNKSQINALGCAPVFIVFGGNTLSRGLTVEGLVCTYFARNSGLADTLMQMARWFGYRKGYELLQRIWMPEKVIDKFELLAKIDNDLKEEIKKYVEQGLTPKQFGPRIRNTPEVAKFLVTAKNKSQYAMECDFDFSGHSYEVTKYDEDEQLLEKNINLTTDFIKLLGPPIESEVGKNSYVWRCIPYVQIDKYLSEYYLSDIDQLSKNMPIFRQWIEKLNEDGRYTNWNVVVAGNSTQKEKRWCIDGDISVGKVDRSRKKDKLYIDIGSLRSGRDAINDLDVSRLSNEEKKDFWTRYKNGTHIIEDRARFGLENTPLLMIYCVDGQGGKDMKTRSRLNLKNDIIGISIIVSGNSIGEGYSKSLRIYIPEEED